MDDVLVINMVMNKNLSFKSNGLYFFDSSTLNWLPLACEEVNLNLFFDGVNFVYFSNNFCPACRLFNLVWYPFVEEKFSKKDNIYFYVALCNWFTENCDSSCARSAFLYFNIKASPTIVIIIKLKDKIIKHYIEGNIKEKFLYEILNQAIKIYENLAKNSQTNYH